MYGFSFGWRTSLHRLLTLLESSRPKTRTNTSSTLISHATTIYWYVYDTLLCPFQVLDIQRLLFINKVENNRCQNTSKARFWHQVCFIINNQISLQTNKSSSRAGLDKVRAAEALFCLAREVVFQHKLFIPNVNIWFVWMKIWHHGSKNSSKRPRVV